MKVGVLGSGAALDLVEAQVGLTDAEIERITPDAIDTVDVAAATGDTALTTINAEAIALGIPLVTIERAQMGGHNVPGVDAAVGIFGATGPCFTCLERRIASTESAGVRQAAPADTVDRIAGAVAGHEVVALLSEEVPVGRVIEFPYRARSLLPVPGCPTCAATDDPWKRPAGEPRSLSAAMEAAERCLDDRVGLVTEIGEAASIPLPYYLSTLADTSAFSDASAPPHAAGVAEDWDRAFMKALGEALERYAAGTFRTDTFELAHSEALEGAIDLDRCVRPNGGDQIDEPIPWVPGEDLASGDRRWLPADLVVFPPGESYVRPPITSGLSLGNSPEETLLGGLLEVIERDASMLSWYSSFEPVEIAVSDPSYESLVKRARLEDLEVTAVLLTQDVDVPVIGAFVRRDDPWPRFAAGSAAGFDPVEAATDAVREALQNWTELAEMGPDGASQEAGRIARYAENPRPLGTYIDPDVRVQAGELGKSPPETTEAALAQLVDAARAVDMTPTAAWVTPRDLREVGFCAARVVVPEAQPLLMGTPYFGDRAEAVPQSMGFRPELDRDPHPFP